MSWFSSRDKVVSEEQLPMCGISCPVNRLPPRRMVSTRPHVPIHSGIGPESRFPSAENATIEPPRFANDAGMSPERALKESKRVVPKS